MKSIAVSNDAIKKEVCERCGKEVIPIVKMFNTHICPQCNRIISSNRGIDRAGI